MNLTSESEIVSTRPSVSLSDSGLTEYLSQDRVLPQILKEIFEKAEELESLGKQYSKHKSKTSRSRSLSNTVSEDYNEIVFKKGLFLDNLTQVVEDIGYGTLEGPKYTIHCYNQFASLLETRCKESKQDIQQKTEMLKDQKLETTSLTYQGGIFANLVEEENEDLGIQEYRATSLQFEEAKADLVKVVNELYPNEEDKNKFLSTLALLVEAHINNLDSIEDQYVEVLPHCLNSPGLRCLMNGFVVVEHPLNVRKLRLCIDD